MASKANSIWAQWRGHVESSRKAITEIPAYSVLSSKTENLSDAQCIKLAIRTKYVCASHEDSTRSALTANMC